MSGADKYLGTTRAAVIRRWSNGEDSLTLGRHFGIHRADICRIIAAEQERKLLAKVTLSRRSAHGVTLAGPTFPG